MRKLRFLGSLVVGAMLCAMCLFVTGCGNDNTVENVTSNGNVSSSLLNAVVEQLEEMDISGAINEAANNAEVALENDGTELDAAESEQIAENMEAWITAIAEQNDVDPQDLPSVADAYENAKNNQSNSEELADLSSLYFNKM